MNKQIKNTKDSISKAHNMGNITELMPWPLTLINYKQEKMKLKRTVN